MGHAIEPLGQGLDHSAYLVDGHLVLRFAEGEGAAAEVEREARLLEFVAAISPLPVPRPTIVAAESRCLGYERLPGVPLIGLAEADRARVAEQIATELGAFLASLHAVPHAEVEALVEPDDQPPADWLAEAARDFEAITPAIPPRHRGAVERFLAAPAPPPAEQLVFSHNDLGVEHVLVDQTTLSITGIVDWSDAALTDPAYDFGLLFRDLGPPALEAAIAGYGTAVADLERRAHFYAGCSLLEDLAYGIEAARPEYVTKSLAALAWVFRG
jgi:aminoglycoside phosphotransferase (APT) family kinase protein